MITLAWDYPELGTLEITEVSYHVLLKLFNEVFDPVMGRLVADISTLVFIQKECINWCTRNNFKVNKFKLALYKGLIYIEEMDVEDMSSRFTLSK